MATCHTLQTLFSNQPTYLLLGRYCTRGYPYSVYLPWSGPHYGLQLDPQTTKIIDILSTLSSASQVFQSIEPGAPLMIYLEEEVQ